MSDQVLAITPQDLNGSAELYPYKGFVLCARQRFIRVNNLEQAGFKSNDVILANDSIKLHTENTVNFYFAKIYMGIISAP